MTVDVQVPVNSYTYAGSSTFPFNFKILQAIDLVVTVDGIAKALGVDYSVSGVGNDGGGSLSYITALTVGQIVVLRRLTALERQTDYQNNGDFLADTVNADFDRLVMMIQERIIEQLRAVRVPVGETVSDLPPAAVRGGYILGFAAGTGDLIAVPGGPGSDATSLALDLANGVLPNKAGGQVAFNGALSYAASTLGWADQLVGMQLDWFYQSGDSGDYAPAFARAVAASLLLTSSQFADSMGQSPYGYGVSRRLNLAGRKYPVNSTLVLSGDVSIYGFGGGFYPGPSFPTDGSYVLDTGANPYGGTGLAVTIDGQDKNVKGILFRNVHYASWDKLKVVSCRNDGIVYAGGAELTLTNFEVSGSATPNSMNVAGLRTQASDGHFVNGVIKYTPIGRKGEGGGNNEFVNLHAWGLFESFRMYLPFYSVNTVRDTFIGCYADSAAKQDYAQDNIVVLNGIPNGGVDFYFDPTSTQNTLIGCRGYINTSAWATYAAAHSVVGNHFYDVYSAGSFTHITGQVHNYAGNWAGDIRWASNAVRDSSIVLGSPNTANGIIVPVLAQAADNGGGATQLLVQNTNNGFATSAAAIAFQVGSGTAAAAIAGTYGAAGASFMSGAVLGVERWRYSALKYTYTGSNATEGDQSAVFNDGVGNAPMLALYRNNGTTTPNAAFAAVKVGSILSNARSINAAGTINASGADYAEYMRKRAGCGAIAKGQVVGVDADGLLTDRWVLAHSFVVKSTDPSYVGGDTWGTLEALGLSQDAEPDDVNAALELARATVDRIAFCGQVPCIVEGEFAVGDFIVAQQAGDGIQAVAVKAPTFEQYRSALGKVWAIRDGRPLLSVKVV